MVQLKLKIKAQISGKVISSGTRVVAFASVYSEKTRLKKMIMIIIIIRLDNSFWGAPEIDFLYEKSLPLKPYQFRPLVLEAVM